MGSHSFDNGLAGIYSFTCCFFFLGLSLINMWDIVEGRKWNNFTVSQKHAWDSFEENSFLVNFPAGVSAEEMVENNKN